MPTYKDCSHGVFTEEELAESSLYAGLPDKETQYHNDMELILLQLCE